MFEGRGFELSHAAMTGLQILFLGNFTESAPPQLLMKKFEDFLQYANDLEKFESNFLLYGERQKNRETPLNPGDALFKALQQPPFDKHFDFNTTGPEQCSYFCK